eukprot:1648860-Rhodomonas_salina.1
MSNGQNDSSTSPSKSCRPFKAYLILKVQLDPQEPVHKRPGVQKPRRRVGEPGSSQGYLRSSRERAEVLIDQKVWELRRRLSREDGVEEQLQRRLAVLWMDRERLDALAVLSTRTSGQPVAVRERSKLLQSVVPDRVEPRSSDS